MFCSFVPDLKNVLQPALPNLGTQLGQGASKLVGDAGHMDVVGSIPFPPWMELGRGSHRHPLSVCVCGVRGRVGVQRG
jgi:hypothetical protein